MGAGDEAPPAESIAVYTRIRSGSDGSESELSLVAGKPEVIRAKNLEFQLDHCFGPTAEQSDCYEVMGKGMVERVVDGFNAAILAYGQTGSGKTFTMLGPEGAKLDGSDPGLGIVPRACMQIFQNIPKDFEVCVSYVEVYNDSVNDLLYKDKKDGGKGLNLREFTEGHVEPEGLTKVPVKDAQGVMTSIAYGDTRRVIAAMAMNPRSSRGHGIITIHILNSEGQPHGRLTLVDLAGMESSKKSPPEGASNLAIRKQEAKAINVSLLALSSVVSALASKGAMRIPFRNSKLTRLLQSSLAGNTKAAFVVTLRSENKNIEEAIGTLRFAQRAKTVQAVVLKNEDLAAAKGAKGGGAVAKRLEAELEMAKNSLADFEAKLALEAQYKENLHLEVQTLLAEMEGLKKDSEIARKRKLDKPAVQGAAPGYPGYVEALERRVIALEEENRVLRQRDCMHRLAAMEPAVDVSDAPKLHVQKENLVTFEPMVQFEGKPQQGGFAMELQRSTSDVEIGRRTKSGRIPVREDVRYGSKAAKGKGIMRAAGFFLSSYRSSSKVHPGGAGGESKAKRVAVRYKPRVPLSTLSGDPKRLLAASIVQATWRGRLTREELYWEMMGYY